MAAGNVLCQAVVASDFGKAAGISSGRGQAVLKSNHYQTFRPKIEKDVTQHFGLSNGGGKFYDIAFSCNDKADRLNEYYAQC